MRYFKLKVYKILNIALPSAMQGALDTVTATLVLFMLGQISSEYIGAGGIATGYYVLLFPVITVFYTGSNILISHAMGAKNFNEIGKIFSSLVIVSFLVSIPTLALSFTMIKPYLSGGR